MARLLTVPAGYVPNYAPTASELQALAAALPANIAINQAAESFPAEYSTMNAVASFVKAGGVYVDYCGWPMYWRPTNGTWAPAPTLFGQFLNALGADSAYCDGFAASDYSCTGYPYERGWLSPEDISSTAGLIVGSGGITCQTCYDAQCYPSGETVYPMVAVRSANGKGMYFYGAAGSSGAVNPGQFASFINSFLSSAPSGGSGGSTGSGGSGGNNSPGSGSITPGKSINWPLWAGIGILGVGALVGLIALIAE